jgi:two-component system, cell cycle response regulator
MYTEERSFATDWSGTRWLRPAIRSLAGELRTLHHPAGHHSQHRLARTVRRLAERMGLDALTATETELVAILHDAGRLAAGGSTHGPLGAAGRDLGPRRTLAGAELLALRAGLDDLVGIIRHIHDHWDGGGRPYGLAGAEIPIGARIVAVVDAHHTMSAGGDGSPTTSHKARMRLAIDAGWRFDPAVVRAYLDQLREDADDRFARVMAPRAPLPPLPPLPL